MAEEAKSVEDKLKEMMSRVLSAEEAIISVKQSLETLIEETHIDITHESIRPNKGRDGVAQSDSGLGKSVDSEVVKPGSRDSSTVVMVQETPPFAKIKRQIDFEIMSSIDEINNLAFVRERNVERRHSPLEHFDTTHSNISDEESKKDSE